MYDVDSVKEWLIGYREMARELFLQEERLERIETRMIGVGAMNISDMPRSPSHKQDRLTDLVALKMELQQTVSMEEEQQKEMRSRVEYVLKQIRSADQRNVIRMRYIDGEEWIQICRSLFEQKKDYDEKADSYLRQVYRLHGYALYYMARYFADSGDKEVEWYRKMAGELKERRARRMAVKARKEAVRENRKSER